MTLLTSVFYRDIQPLTFLAESTADYLLYGLDRVGTHIEDVPSSVQDLIGKVHSI